MGADDKIRHAVDDAKGKVKETVGKITNNEDMEAEGKVDSTKADVGKATEDVKDVFKS